MSYHSLKAFYDRNMNDHEVAKRAAYDIRKEVDAFFIEKLGVKESNLEAHTHVLYQLLPHQEDDPHSRSSLRVARHKPRIAEDKGNSIQDKAWYFPYTAIGEEQRQPHPYIRVRRGLKPRYDRV